MVKLRRCDGNGLRDAHFYVPREESERSAREETSGTAARGYAEYDAKHDGRPVNNERAALVWLAAIAASVFVSCLIYLRAINIIEGRS